jgi:hypothetical protein
MAKFDYKRPGDEKTLEGGGSGGGYSSAPYKIPSYKTKDTSAEAVKALGTGATVAGAGALAALASTDRDTSASDEKSAKKRREAAAVSQLSGAGDRLVKSTKEAADSIGGGVRKYKNAKSEEADLDTELDSQTKRETRGKAKGGKVKAYAKGGSVSARADGCAQRGKTKGRIV